MSARLFLAGLPPGLADGRLLSGSTRSSLCAACVLTCSYDDTRHVGSGPTVMNSCPLGPLHKDPVCKSGPILGCWGLGLRHRSLGTSLTVSLVVRSSVPISQMRTPWPWRGGGCLSYLLRRECAPRGLPPALVSVASGCTKPFVEGNPGPRRLLQ